MAGATWAAYNDAMKDVWTDDALVSQLLEENDGVGSFLKKIEMTDKHTIGNEARVPLKRARNGGFSVTGTSGSSALNAAGNVNVDRAVYGLVFNYQRVKIEHAAIVTTGTKPQAVASVIDTEMTGAVEEARRQITRQVFGDQTALIAKCGTTNSSSTVVLDVSEGYAALLRQYLHPTLTVDIGTTSSEDSIVAGTTISAVAESDSAPTITIGSSVSTTSSNYVSIANARSGSTSLEMNGLQNIIGTGTLGGVTGGNDWQAAGVDSSTTDLTLDSLLALQEKVQMKTGAFDLDVLMSFKQKRRFYELFQNQVRFTSGDAVAAGSTDAIKWNGMNIAAFVDVPDSCVFFVKMEDLLLVTAGKGAHWIGEAVGDGQRLTHADGTTAFNGMFAYPLNLAARRRNRSAKLDALT